MKKRKSERPQPEEAMPASTVSARDYLGIDLTEIPLISIFVDTPDVEMRASESPQYSNNPDWVYKLLTISGAVARKSRMAVVVAEISVLTDTFTHGPVKPFFTTNIVCPKEPEGQKSDTPILSAYLSAIRNIAREGTTINTSEFHALHYVHVSGLGRRLREGSFSDRPTVSHYRNNVLVTPLNSKYRRRNKQIDFERHHRDFFEHFEMMLDCENSSNPEDHLHYLALPFQRPAHITAAISTDHPLRLEPAGALYLILQPDKSEAEGTESCAEQIATISARLQYICMLSCLKASSLLADRRAMVAAASEARLRAYDGIGHALRAFVEATKYKGALELLSAIQHDDRLPKDFVKTIAHVRRSIAFFEHAEALGSLMRLHGWLGVDSGDRRRHLNKVIDCFDEEQVRAIQEAKLDSNVIVAAAARVISALASALAYKDEVVFRIRYKDAQAECVRSLLVEPETELSDEVEAEPVLPPLRIDGDRGAVQLAINVALLEPLRNASMHVRGRDPASVVEVLLEERLNGGMAAYIGNQWYGSGASDVDMLTLSTGIGLVQKMLAECRLGGFFNTTIVDIKHRIEALIDLAHNYDGYVWIGIQLEPLTLYSFAKGDS
jgi:hypothetical protein